MLNVYRIIIASICLAYSGGGTFVLGGNLPAMRPALVGSGPKALINLIDTQGLIKRGQGHAALFFYCIVQPDGTVTRFNIYGNTPDSQKLKEEIINKIKQARFIPAVYNHHHVFASLHGTVAFSVVDGKPHLRIFANQDLDELKKESDFISPQPIEIPGHHYDYIKYPARSWASEDVPGAAQMKITVDASGKLTDIKLTKEIPPGNKFGETAIKEMKNRTYLPAFRNGQPVDSTTDYTLYFVPGGWSLQ